MFTEQHKSRALPPALGNSMLIGPYLTKIAELSRSNIKVTCHQNLIACRGHCVSTYSCQVLSILAELAKQAELLLSWLKLCACASVWMLTRVEQIAAVAHRDLNTRTHGQTY